MTQTEQISAAKEFVEFWKDKGDEKQHTQQFWTSLLRDVYGVSSPEKVIDFEKRVKINGTKFIDGYISDTRVAIEQKGTKIDLDKAERQSDKEELTPFGQAKRYNDNLPYSEKCRWIVVSNFTEFRIYDMERIEPEKEFETVKLCDLPKEFYRLQFLVDLKNENIRREEELSLKAGELVGKLYDALIKEYIDPDEKSLRSLNILCVRIVFCLYAEDAGLFDSKTAFEDYIKSFAIENLRDGIIKLFKALDSKERDKYDLKLKPFPYVNGGLFRDEQIEIPNFTQEIVDVIVNHCAPFNWSDISPTIFGAVFESTLNPETRRKGGMHYTSIQNIHKVIDPLFMDDLNAEFESICATKTAKQKTEKLHDFQAKLGSLKFLDPACGSGNFLTETYISLRRLENKVLSILFSGDKLLGFDEFIKVHINQFYGIEINDFAVTVAKTALWIAESQMIAETEEIISQNIDFLPLTTNAFIVEGNALRMDWSTLKSLEENALPKGGLFSGFTTETDGTKHEYDYIMGNPPFVGTNYLSDLQRADMDLIWDNDDRGKLDFVSCWYVKATNLIQNTQIKCAFVSTNSITQGEQATSLWKKVFTKNIAIDFAYRTFQWDSESSLKAHVHCVIVGFSDKNSVQKQKVIFDESGNKFLANNINHYLLDAPTIFIEEVSKPLCNVPAIVRGSQATDDGYYLFTEEEKNDFIKRDPNTELYFKQFMMGKEFINNIKRYCLWIPDISPKELKDHKGIYERVQKVKAFRESSKNTQTRQSADTPTRFGQYRPPAKQYIAFAKVSSERRRYIPFGFLTDDIIPGDKLFTIPNATLYYFGILTSNIHMAWMRAVCGRLKSDYSYSTTIVYNNFPWCSPTAEQKAKIEQSAQAILDARAKYPDSSLADLYDEITMPADLRKAHRENDKAVMQAYGFKANMTESEIVGELFKLYENLVKV
ncbi:MAG: methylase [Treponema sp.]|nr:methylase [Treponema sp.]